MIKWSSSINLMLHDVYIFQQVTRLLIRERTSKEGQKEKNLMGSWQWISDKWLWCPSFHKSVRCLRICMVRASLDLYVFSQRLQGIETPSKWIASIWRFMFILCSPPFPHTLQTYNTFFPLPITFWVFSNIASTFSNWALQKTGFLNETLLSDSFACNWSSGLDVSIPAEIGVSDSFLKIGSVFFAKDFERFVSTLQLSLPYM